LNKIRFEERHCGYVGGIFPRVIPSEDLFGQLPLVGGEKIFLVVFMGSVLPQAAFASEV